MVCIILTKHGGERERPNYFSTEISSKWFLLVREVCVCWWHPVVPVVVTFSKFVSPRVASGSVPMATCGSVVNVNSLRQIPEEEKRGQNSMIMLVLSCLRWQDGWKEVLEVLPVSLAFGWWIECLVLHMRFEVGGGGGWWGGGWNQGPVCNSYKCLHKWYPAGNRKQDWQKFHQLLYRPGSSVLLQLVFPRESDAINQPLWSFTCPLSVLFIQSSVWYVTPVQTVLAQTRGKQQLS